MLSDIEIKAIEEAAFWIWEDTAKILYAIVAREKKRKEANILRDRMERVDIE